MPSLVGQPLLRREDRTLLLGQGLFAGDVQLTGLVHMAVVRSAFPHAELGSIDLTSARQAPGVLGAYGLSDLPEITGPLADPSPPGLEAFPRPVLARERVRYAGEPIAVVVAATAEQAADAAELVEVDMRPLDGAGDVLTATAPDAPVLHQQLGSNVAGRVERRFGDVESAFAADAVIVRQSFRLGRVIGGYMEPRACVASYDPDSGQLTVSTSTQWVYGVRDRIAALLELEPERVRVRAPDVGGGFGAKGQVYPEEILVPALARRLGRPVQWVATRTEDTLATGQSHGTAADAELAADPVDGRLRGLRIRLLHDVGAYGGPGLGQSDNILSHVVSAYRLPALSAEATLVYTSTVPSGFIRGGGREIGNFIVERLMDRLAQRLALDPAEVRRRNLIQPTQMPYTTGYLRFGSRPVVYDGGDYPRLLAEALSAVDYEDARRRQSAGAKIGIGVACCVESAGITQPEPARVEIRADGHVDAYLGGTPGGQGHRTVFAQVIADRLGWPIEQVHVHSGDTTSVVSSANTAGSRSALEVGNAAAAVAAAARARLVERAAGGLEVAPTDVELGPGGASVRGAPARHVHLSELVDGGLAAEETFRSQGAYTGACHAVIVEVDPETARVRILDYAIAHDCGRSINPRLVDGQLQGGVVHGLGYAMFEEAVYLPDGTLASQNFLDYALPGRGQPTELAPHLVAVESPIFGHNPAGFKGVGETGTIAAPAAIVGAIEDALGVLGVPARLGILPLTPTRLFDALAGRSA
ncbi:MAG: xanthine dehydrogenase family protein molybdopterin-binding subunit [Chloroflexi bacterium]|nr:xanthine dehydrogenase family protein molybdopterin-binding subunit [Chloroflexota bacterium]